MFKNKDKTNYAFNLIVRKHTATLYKVVRRMVIDSNDTDDVLQNVFLKAWKGLTNFREDASLSTWLYRIATNESITFINKKRKLLFIPLQSQETYLTHKLEADQHVDYDKGEKRFLLAITRLPEKQRLVFNMKFFDELPYEDISAITGTSVGALKASYHLASKKIEEFMGTD